MFVSELPCLLDSVPGTINHADSVFFTAFLILLRDDLLSECTKDDSFEFLFLVLDGGQQLESFHLLACTFLTVTLLKVYHEKWNLSFWLLYLFPFAGRLLLLFILFMRLFFVLLVRRRIFLDLQFL